MLAFLTFFLPYLLGFIAFYFRHQYMFNTMDLSYIIPVSAGWSMIPFILALISKAIVKRRLRKKLEKKK